MAGTLARVLHGVMGEVRARRLFALTKVEPQLLADQSPSVSRAIAAQALAMALLDDLLRRVPDGGAYAQDRLDAGETLTFDHGALRTVALDGMGDLPGGQTAVTRILEPLGYEIAGTYPLDRLGMTGRAFAHRDFPEDIAQYFVSELHPERFSETFQAAVRAVTSSSVDPLTVDSAALLTRFTAGGVISVPEAVALVRNLIACFDRQHTVPSLADHETLLSESAEMAWISTEGNAFNHATDRVADVEDVAARQKALGRPMKAAVEVARGGRVRQTAFHAARVLRQFSDADGGLVEREVPGSFFEFITREVDAGQLDLNFDSSNAQGIFKMTAQAA
jgi:hypothetical protein